MIAGSIQQLGPRANSWKIMFQASRFLCLIAKFKKACEPEHHPEWPRIPSKRKYIDAINRRIELTKSRIRIYRTETVLKPSRSINSISEWVVTPISFKAPSNRSRFLKRSGPSYSKVFASAQYIFPELRSAMMIR